jgi:hypothetical protein
VIRIGIRTRIGIWMKVEVEVEAEGGGPHRLPCPHLVVVTGEILISRHAGRSPEVQAEVEVAAEVEVWIVIVKVHARGTGTESRGGTGTIVTRVSRVDTTVEETAVIVETTGMTTAGGHVETVETDPETVLVIDLGREIIDPVGEMIGMIVGTADAETDETQGRKGENVRIERASTRIETVVEMIAEKRVG